MQKQRAETIVAQATPPGPGGVGVVRLSGPDAREILASLFHPAHSGFIGFRPRFMHHGELLDRGGRAVDEVLAVFFPGPASFTGEDVAELHCHGSPAVLREAVEAAHAAGARPAERGEFTRRAYLNGKLDLAQAEAVAELIAAPGREAAEQASARLAGMLSGRVDALREELVHLRTAFCLAVDFPEDEVECAPPDKIGGRLQSVLQEVRRLTSAAGRGKLVREGALVVLAGRVNAGKSSLLNALLGRERAIVSECPGTTRDYLEEACLLDGLPARLVDTAGLRETQGEVELEGVRRSRELLDAADLALLVLDASAPPFAAEAALAEELGPSRCLVVMNKADLPGAVDEPPPEFSGFPWVRVSARSGRGLDTLSRAAREMAEGSAGAAEAAEVAPNRRQARALERAAVELEELLRDQSAGVPPDLLGVRLESACAALEEVSGRIAPEDVLEEVFTSFCIGK